MIKIDQYSTLYQKLLAGIVPQHKAHLQEGDTAFVTFIIIIRKFQKFVCIKQALHIMLENNLQVI